MACNKCKLGRWGRHRNGTPRWRCKICGLTKSREKPRPAYGLLKRYLLDGDTCEQLAADKRVHSDTIRRQLHPIFDSPPSFPDRLDIPQPCWLITDATHFKRWGCLLVTKATGVKHPLAVSFYDKECFETVAEHLKPLEKLAVAGFTTDGKRGLVMAHRLLFPDTGHQRCLVHIRMKVQTLLTCHPKLSGGQDLLALSAKLMQVTSTDQAQNWWADFCSWREQYQLVLTQRTYRGKSWWYTHRNLRRAWKHIENAADSLFVFLAYSNSVSHTNHLEGLFGQRKPALARHRGLSRHRVANALLWTFYLRHRYPRVS
ncbi:MAG: hypothetical protein UU93_C0004G0022 [Candidatus Amesbacteria bacterium GW2011_GWA2_42_12]|uniref:Transposase n=1 Tax=Candidatus Amesbacteria bacterium GW2011_GWA2_42_12 TaxID=1618356 RepID=A0A0G0Y8E6_9BACT|nr:MAG: hypothetical protein UU93_C0004G0022 [Candidatus Amesbacteria bacterium GW2011_GWA2_42_12]